MALALMVDGGLLALFALQHSIMARPWFKRAWTRVVPEPAERSTYVLFSSVAMFLMFGQWQPIGAVVWNVGDGVLSAVMIGLYAAGLLIVLLSTFLINHFDLFGLRQVWRHVRGEPQQGLKFVLPVLYRIVRHPLYVGWFFAFWCTPTMTVTHLVFAVMTTAYILIAIQFEERDLVHEHPEYADYRRRVPMLIPFLRGRGSASPGTGATAHS